MSSVIRIAHRETYQQKQERRKAGTAVMNKTDPYKIRVFFSKPQQK
jgi:hypothetical protein